MAAFYQPLFVPSGNDWSNFGFDYVRPHISGNLIRPWLEYWCSFEFNSFPPFLLDCYVDARPWKFFGIRGGQFWTLLSRHEYLGPQEVLFPDWATSADYFWTGRDRGVQLFGETNYVDYYASFTAGTTLTQTASVPGNFQLMGRVDINPLGRMGATEMPFVASEDPVPFRFSFALQGVYGRVNPNGVGFNSSAFLQLNQQGERTQAIGAVDLLVQWGRFGFFGEFYGRHVEPRDVPTLPFTQYGAWAQAHYTFFRRILDFARALRLDRSEHDAGERSVLRRRGAAGVVHLRHVAGAAAALRRGASARSRAGAGLGSGVPDDRRPADRSRYGAPDYASGPARAVSDQATRVLARS